MQQFWGVFIGARGQPSFVCAYPDEAFEIAAGYLEFCATVNLAPPDVRVDKASEAAWWRVAIEAPLND